jgi:hypothetical protein
MARRAQILHPESSFPEGGFPMSQRILQGAVCLVFLGLIAQRIWSYASFEQNDLRMPSQVIEAEEQDLFRSPGGIYSLADIASNGELLPSQRYAKLQTSHDYSPRTGETICPITRTKANRECTWIVGGRSYEFCCPPCISEFVRQAKEQPGNILSPQEYVME